MTLKEWTTKTINAALILELDDGLKVYTDLRWFFVKFPDWSWCRVCKKYWLKDLFEWYGRKFVSKKIRDERITYVCEGGENVLKSLTFTDIIQYPEPPDISVKPAPLALPDFSHLKLPRVEVIVTKGDLEKAIIAFCSDNITNSNGNETSESLADWLIVVSNKVREL